MKLLTQVLHFMHDQLLCTSDNCMGPCMVQTLTIKIILHVTSCLHVNNACKQ